MRAPFSLRAASMTSSHSIALGVLLLCAGCVLSIENGRVDPPDLGTDPVAAGRRTFLTRCASCHGLEARGDGPVGAALRVPPPDLTWLAERNGGTFPRSYVIAVVTGDAAIPAHGSREMPVWSDRFFPSDGNGAAAAASLYARRITESLADYLATIQRRLGAAFRR
jgi:mono/diheme cytochrome c family protein